jgi:uncharacterized protein YuzE
MVKVRRRFEYWSSMTGKVIGIAMVGAAMLVAIIVL